MSHLATLRRLGVQLIGKADHQALRYLPEETPDPSEVPVRADVHIGNANSLARRFSDVRREVNHLVSNATHGERIGGSAFEKRATEVSSLILPAATIARVIGTGYHPAFDAENDHAAQIPWEILAEDYLLCAKCAEEERPNAITKPPPGQDPGDRFCTRHGTPLQSMGGKLALTYHLSFRVARTLPGTPPPGKDFLFIIDPTEDLTSPQMDPQGICKRHVGELRDMLTQAGYNVNCFAKGKNATTGRVLEAIANPNVVGIYYFGHGYFPEGAAEGRLLLADNELTAHEFEEALPSAKFVFLNACSGASQGENWNLEPGHSSVAHAFARGKGGKVAIAPIWPVVNFQAAESALLFFRKALGGAALGEALMDVRKESHAQFLEGRPHLSWMAYRFFGEVDRKLPPPEAAPIAVAQPTCRIINDEGKIEKDFFGFDIDRILFRAAERRLLQNRRLVSLNDLVAGLVKKGDLTRRLLTLAGQSQEMLDTLFPRLCDTPDAESEETGGEARAEEGEAERAADESALLAALRDLAGHLTVRTRSQLTEGCAEVLLHADRKALSRHSAGGEQSQISEADLLAVLLDGGRWPDKALPGLPPAADVRHAMEADAGNALVDENGELRIGFLAPDARRVVQTALSLAQARGQRPIPNRVFLAAFFRQGTGHAARLGRERGHDPRFLSELLMALVDAKPHESFGLTPAVCERSILPALQIAHKKAANPAQVTEKELFDAYCQAAPPPFKDLLKEALELDLDAMIGADPKPIRPVSIDHLGTEAQSVIQAALRLANEHGVFPITSRIMMAAFLAPAEGVARRRLRAAGADPDSVREELLRLSPPDEDAQTVQLSPDACERIVAPMLEEAARIADDAKAITEDELFSAFCRKTPDGFKELLKALDEHADLDNLPPADDDEGGEGGGGRPPEDEEEQPPGKASDGEASPPAQSGSAGFGPGIAQPDTVSLMDFDDAGRSIVQDAAEWALVAGHPAIRSPHLFAALIGDGNGAVGGALRGQSADTERVKRAVLSVVPPAPRPPTPEPVAVSSNVCGILSFAVALARRSGRERAGETEIANAFFTDNVGVVDRVLEHLGIRRDLVTAHLAEKSRGADH